MLGQLIWINIKITVNLFFVTLSSLIIYSSSNKCNSTNTTPSDATRKKREILIKDVVKKACSDSDVEATASLTHKRNKTHACDKNTTTFYHSVQGDGGGVSNPNLTLNLNGTYRITTIKVVNVHTGLLCEDADTNQAQKCINRLKGAEVGVLTGKKTRTNNVYFKLNDFWFSYHVSDSVASMTGFNLLKIFRFQRKKRCHAKTKLTLKFEHSDEKTFNLCGRIKNINDAITTEAQTYPIKCDGEGLTGNQVRVRLEGEGKILEIAEISVEGYMRIGKYYVMNRSKAESI